MVRVSGRYPHKVAGKVIDAEPFYDQGTKTRPPQLDYRIVCRGDGGHGRWEDIRLSREQLKELIDGLQNLYDQHQALFDSIQYQEAVKSG